MRFWIGVVGTRLSYERFMTTREHWFCMPRSCSRGDKVLMYASKSAAGVMGGIFGLFEIKDIDDSKYSSCKNYGIFSGTGERPVYVELQELRKFKCPISFAKIKANFLLASSSFVRRKFQATYFNIEPEQFDTICLIEQKLSANE